MKISQREARRNRKRLRELEEILAQQRRNWVSEWPSSTCIGGLDVDNTTAAIVKTARTLGHAVVVVPVATNRIGFFGVKI